MGETAALQVEGYRKVYGDFVAVEGLSVSLPPGRVLGLVGPNGAGKTTTLQGVAGILTPTAGRVVVDGHDLDAAPLAARARLAYVPDDPRLFEALTVWEHLRFAAEVYQVADWEDRARRILDRFELLDKADRTAQALSRGMRQKLALSAAWLHRPALLMLDEPMTGLDPRGIRTLKAFVREAAAEGAGLVVSSHQLDLVQDLADDLLILIDGRARFWGTMAEARAELGEHEADTLEAMFFRATEGPEGGAAPPRPAEDAPGREVP